MKKIGLLIFVVFSLFLVSCNSGEKENPFLSIALKQQQVSAEAGSQFLSITSNSDWTITVSDDWVSVTPQSGNGDMSSVIVSYESNGGAQREATISVTCSSIIKNVALTQLKAENAGGAGEILASSAPVKWLELPETSDSDGFDFLSHQMKVGTTATRNYSLYWDYDNLVAPWVAYPLCTWNKGQSVDRTDAWGLDPLLPRSKQPVLFSGFSEGSAGWYARGHQLPSADRLTSYSSNSMTFYSTNMTPQLNDKFNATIWANLESQVRTWAKNSDTLYVVTGCVTEGSKDYCYDNERKKVTVPVGYFKAVLRFRSNSTIGFSNYAGCAVYMEHKEYSNSTFSSKYAMSISALEEKLGYKLFVNLPSVVGEDTAKKIKNQDPVSVDWWW